jgi:hypothetical protein
MGVVHPSPSGDRVLYSIFTMLDEGVELKRSVDTPMRRN